MSPAGRAEYADFGQQFGKGFWIRLENQTSYIVTSVTIDIHIGTGDRWLRRRAERFSVAASLVGLAAGLVVHVCQNPFKFVGLVITSRKGAHAARICNLYGNFRLVGETKYRDIDAKHLRNTVSHETSQHFVLNNSGQARLAFPRTIQPPLYGCFEGQPDYRSADAIQ
jgi:hypothetical protein